jgi:hypothetical protein
MKVVLVLIVLAIIVVGLVYKFGGYQSFDPTAQGREAKAKIQPGMTVKQVVDAAGPNGKFHNISVQKQKIRGEETVTEVKGPAVDFSANQLTARVQRKELPNGFTIEYIFSQQAAFEVTFDSTGKVTGVEDVKTMADFLDSREH